MPCVFPTFANPLGEEFALTWGELSFGFGRWHRFGLRVNTSQQFALGRVVWIHTMVTTPVCRGILLGIEPELVGVLGRWAVADEALIGKYRQDFASEINRRSRCCLVGAPARDG